VEQLGAFSIKEFCTAFAVGRTTVHALIKRGAIDSFKVGRRRLISAEAAEKWRRHCESETASTRVA